MSQRRVDATTRRPPRARRACYACVLAYWLCVALAGSPMAVFAEESSKVQRPLVPSIPAGPLDKALRQLLASWDAQVLYSPALLAGRNTPGSDAALPPRAALASVLRGTGLNALEVTPNSYILQAGRTLTPAKPVATPEVSLPPVQVTGSRIARMSLQTSYPVNIITQEDIRASGAQNVFDYLRRWPGMTGHHPRDAATDMGSSPVPLSQSSSASLYSLGTGATLYLLNGARIANYGSISASLGATVDLNSIPLSMIDRIEIANGASSAIYGSDAMAGVVNIILKKGHIGGEISSSFSVSARGDAITRATFASYGRKLPAGGDFFFSAEHRNEDGLVGGQRNVDKGRPGAMNQTVPYAWFEDGYSTGRFCFPGYAGPDRCGFNRIRYVSRAPQLESTGAAIGYRSAHDAEWDTEAHLLLSRSNVEVQYPPYFLDLPLNQDGVESSIARALIDVGPVRSRSRSLAVNASVKASGTIADAAWTVNASHSANTTDSRTQGLVSIRRLLSTPSFMADVFNSPSTAALITPDTRIDGKGSISSVTASIGDPALFTLAGRDVSGLVGFEVSEEQFRFRPNAAMKAGDILGYTQDLTVDNARRVRAAQFGEVTLQPFSTLTLDAAWRVDWDDSGFDRVSPKLGGLWAITSSLAVRASHSRGFRAPTLFEERVLRSDSVLELVPSRLGPCLAHDPFHTDYCDVILRSVHNPDLQPERSRSNLIGVALTPRGGLDLTLSYYDIVVHRRITQVDWRDAERFPDVLVRDSNGLLSEVHTTLRNAGTAEVGGWQLNADFHKRINQDNALHVSLLMDRLTHFSATGADRIADTLPTLASLSRSKINATLQWSAPLWQGALYVHYRSGANPRASAPGAWITPSAASPPRIPSFFTVGLSIGTTVGPWSTSLSVDNLLDTEPVNTDGNFAGQSVSDDDSIGRRYSLSLTRGF
jgi:iron complex outermembrane receptor protein